jgi:site-specific recombinase XerD
VMGRDVEATDTASLAGWRTVRRELGDSDVLLRALDLLGDELASSTRQRLVSTLRGFCGYLTRRGLLAADPTDAEELRVRGDSMLEVRALTDTDIDALLTAASEELSARVTSSWPTRDTAIVDVLAHCGLRVSELCALTIGAIDETGEQALVRIRAGSKGGKRRSVPIPAATLASIDAYLDERAGELKPATRLFVRHDHSALNQQFVDGLLRRLCAAADVIPPQGAMAHALRHSYGMRLALRGVPLPAIQQLLGHSDPRPSAIYTAAHATDLTHALHDAGLL